MLLELLVDGTGEPWEYMQMDGYIEIMQLKLLQHLIWMTGLHVKNVLTALAKNSDMLKPFPKGTYKPTLPEKLMITGVLDGDLSGGYPKALELYAVTDIADLTKYGIDVASNGKANCSSTIDYFLMLER